MGFCAYRVSTASRGIADQKGQLVFLLCSVHRLGAAWGGMVCYELHSGSKSVAVERCQSSVLPTGIVFERISEWVTCMAATLMQNDFHSIT